MLTFIVIKRFLNKNFSITFFIFESKSTFSRCNMSLKTLYWKPQKVSIFFSRWFLLNILVEITTVVFKNQLFLSRCFFTLTSILSDAFYWLVENEEKQIDLFKLELPGKWTKICTTSLKSVREEDKWSKLRKTLEKSEGE